ncbi:putative NAD-dependent epimerase/dehydratase [Podospora didyma]|uniref:NAD-dependent epimerase/dehydratase n=1 Tax=Podospora didyma TaxID=330526 RepID=A0AAE0K4R5_9PEZI|nr:putative NAD-dependent epimerase/dehydratase [Podospora didyma]
MTLQNGTAARPIYAVLGSTGNCGKALIQNLLESPANQIHAYCRNQAKLHRQLPEVVDNKQVRVFEGSIYDVDLMATCVRGAKAVFLVVTTNDNIPRCRVAQDLAGTVIAALQKLKSESPTPGLKMPKLVLLSSSTIDDYLARHMPWWFRPVMLTAASNVYADLRVAETLLRSHASWVDTIFIKPGGLSVDEARGHRLTLDEEDSFLSYLDLSAGMIEAVQDEEGRYDGRNVGVVNAKKGHGAKFPKGTPLCILVGLLRHYFPWMHGYLPATGPS